MLDRAIRWIQGERLDNKTNKHPVNCAGCGHKVGRLCTYHKAFLQSNQHRPTDCENWVSNEHEGL